MDEKIMYEKNEAVRNLNRVEGFEPKDYLRKEASEDGISMYLDTKYRLLWYRLMYPKGKIIKIPKTLNKDYATFEARIYADVNDAPENFLANGFASRYRDDTNEQFGMNFVEMAETAALGRALKDAGFGTQFCDIALPNDGKVVDAGISIILDETAAEALDTGNTDEKISEPAKGETASPKAEIAATPLKEKLVLTKEMPYDELISKMTLEYAKSVVVDYGYDSGRNLGELAVNKPQSIKFHASRATNNLIKAAAQFLLDKASVVA